MLGVNVLFVSEGYPPTDGGVATSAQRVARNLVRLGARVHVVTFDHSCPVISDDYTVEEDDEGVRISRIGPFFLKQKEMDANAIPEKAKAILRRRAFSQMCRLARQSSPHCILSFYLINAGFLATFLAAELDLPHIAGVRGNDVGRNIFLMDRFAVTQWVLSKAHRIICVNNHLQRRMLLAFPELRPRSLVIHNSVQELTVPPRGEVRQRVLSRAGWEQDDFILTFIGSLREKKGVMPLLKGMEAVTNDLPIRLLVIGPRLGRIEERLCGDQWAFLERKRKLFCTGLIAREEVSQWAAGADALVMPSLDDGLANGLLEGMAMGLCPIATEIFDDVIVHGERGLLMRAGDSGSLVEGIRRLHADLHLRQQMGQNARAYVEAKHQPHHEAQDYLRVIQAAAEGGLRTHHV